MRGGSKQETKTRSKSIEGFDIAWIEEAQSCSEESIDLFFPSIRKDGSKIICTWNPYLVEDPIEKKIAESSFGKIISVNYYDNPLLSGDEAKIANELKEKNYKKYEHIYLGKPSNIEGLCYSMFDRIKHVIKKEESDKMARTSNSYHIGLDWGFSHPMGMVMIHKLGERYLITDCYRKTGQVINVKWLMGDFYSFSRDSKIAVCDNARPELIEYCDKKYKDDTKEVHSTKFIPCAKYQGSVLDEINTINTLFMNGRLLISETCVDLIGEILSFTWKDGSKEIPEDIGEDLCRAMGYGIMYSEKYGKNSIKIV
jgi:phage terminase large subunit